MVKKSTDYLNMNIPFKRLKKPITPEERELYIKRYKVEFNTDRIGGEDVDDPAIEEDIKVYNSKGKLLTDKSKCFELHNKKDYLNMTKPLSEMDLPETLNELNRYNKRVKIDPNYSDKDILTGKHWDRPYMEFNEKKNKWVTIDPEKRSAKQNGKNIKRENSG